MTNNILNLAATDSYSELYLTNNLRKLMDMRHINEAELARQTNIPQPTLHKILTGKTIDPRASTLKLLADHFGVSLDELLIGPISPAKQVGKTQTIPIISWTECVDSKNFIAKLSQQNWHKWATIELLSPSAYGLMSKSTMEPRFAKGTILIIDPEATQTCGDMIVVLYPNCTEATIREYICDGPSALLQPICPGRHADNLTKHIKILGVLIKTMFNYR